MEELRHNKKFRAISSRLLVSFLLLFSLFGLKQFVVHYQMNQEENTSHILNLSGRQRMLSQKIVKKILLLDTEMIDETESLEVALDEFERAQEELIECNQVDKITQRQEALIIRLYQEINPSYESLVEWSHVYLKEYQRADSDEGLLEEYLTLVMANESVFLEKMDEIVFTYESEARQALKFIQGTNVFLFVVILLIGFFIFWRVFMPLIDTTVQSYLYMRNMREDLLRILDTMKGILFLVNAEGEILFKNEASQKIIHNQEAKNIEEAVKWLNFSMIDFIAQVESGKDVNEDLEILAEEADGHITPLSLSAVKGRYREEEVVLLTLADLTKQKNAEAILEKIATRDSLTGLYNRHFLETVIESEFDRADQYDLPLSAILLDIDDFKMINDCYGHPAGDSVLKLLAETIQDDIRASDYAIRIGGEEILIFLPNTALKDALFVAEDLRKTLAALDHPGIGQVTASFGVAERLPAELYLTLYSRVDDALYQAKAKGKNRVEPEEKGNDMK